MTPDSAGAATALHRLSPTPPVLHFAKKENAKKRNELAVLTASSHFAGHSAFIVDD
jgi:hypothetical protein